MVNARNFLLATGLILISASAAAAQEEIRGVLQHERTDQPVASGLVRLMLPSGAVIDSVRTDSAGTFRFQVPRAGTYALAAEGDGYAPSRSQAVRVGANEVVTVQVRIDSVVLLDPLVVTARDDLGGWLGEFRFRRRAYEPFGGRYFTREDFDWMAAGTPSEVVASLVPTYFLTSDPYRARPNVFMTRPRLTVRTSARNFGGECEPFYYVNYHRIEFGRRDMDGRIEEFVNLGDVTAIEVYRPGVTAPAGIGSGCGGVIIFWTLPDHAPR
jgi:hypothetical protein